MKKMILGGIVGMIIALLIGWIFNIPEGIPAVLIGYFSSLIGMIIGGLRET